MTAKAPAALRVFTDVWFLAGIGLGLLAVVPKILLNYGIEIGQQGEGWFNAPGVVAYFCLIVGVFYAEARYVYVAAVAGVLINGLVYWLFGVAVRGVFKLVRGLKAPKAPGSEQT